MAGGPIPSAGGDADVAGAPHGRLEAARVRAAEPSGIPVSSPAAAREAGEAEHSSTLGDLTFVGRPVLADRVGASLVGDHSR